MFLNLWTSPETDTEKQTEEKKRLRDVVSPPTDSSSGQKEDERHIEVTSLPDNEEVWWDESLKNVVQAEENERFWVHEGGPISNILELRDELVEMSDGQYLYHATGEQNDFAAWVEGVLEDGRIAHLLRNAQSREEAVEFIDEALSGYNI